MTLKLTEPDPRPDRLPQTLLDIAAEVEADEAQIKQRMREAAERGDCAAVIELLDLWESKPPAEVLSHALIDAGDLR